MISLDKYAKINHKNSRELCRLILKNKKEFSGHMRIQNGVIELDEKGTAILEKLNNDIQDQKHPVIEDDLKSIMSSQKYEAAKQQKNGKEIVPWTF